MDAQTIRAAEFISKRYNIIWNLKSKKGWYQMEKGKRKGRGMAWFFLCMVVLLIFICLGQKKIVRANEDTDIYLDSQGVRYTLYDNHTCAVTGYTEPIKDSIVIP